jgi:uncharacterized protein
MNSGTKEMSSSITSAKDVMQRVEALDWNHISQALDSHGNAIIENLISSNECDALVNLYSEDNIFRSRVVMEQHGFGRGEYRYFNYPLPDIIVSLRTHIYPHLAPIANQWNKMMNITDVSYPEKHADFIARCHDAGQLKPTPLLLKYGEDDYNCLHQDLYGLHVFPLQLTILLSEPQHDFMGGEFVLTEQRMQSRPEVVPLRRGDAVIFAVKNRPVKGTHGNVYRVNLRHGVSRIRSGYRYTLGIMFHDAK